MILNKLDIMNAFLSTWRSSGRSLHGATFGVCCSGGGRECVSSLEIFVWFETESLCLVWQIQFGS